MDTSVWGPPMWRLLHNIAWQLQPDSYGDFVELVHALAPILPCKYCRQSYVAFVECFPLSRELLQSQDDMGLRWVWFVHDLVNRKLQNSSLAYNKLVKRLRTTAEELTRNDVLLTLSFFGRNYSNNTECEMAHNLFVFCRCLARLLARHPSHTFKHMGVGMVKLLAGASTVAASQARFMQFIRDMGSMSLPRDDVDFEPWYKTAPAVVLTRVDNNLQACTFSTKATVASLIDFCSAEGNLQRQINERVAEVEHEFTDNYKPCKKACTVAMHNVATDSRGLVQCILSDHNP